MHMHMQQAQHDIAAAMRALDHSEGFMLSSMMARMLSSLSKVQGPRFFDSPCYASGSRVGPTIITHSCADISSCTTAAPHFP
jgi:hypothetical protein